MHKKIDGFRSPLENKRGDHFVNEFKELILDQDSFSAETEEITFESLDALRASGL